MTNQFTDEQVEAAAIGYNTFPWNYPELSWLGKQHARIRSALEAAASVAPQALSACLSCDRPAAFCAHCVAEMEAAPVQPSSTVDEGKLTQAIYDELMTDDAVSEVWSNGKVMATARRLAKFAVVEAIGGESRAHD